VFLFVISLMVAVYEVFELISPTIFGGAGGTLGRDETIRGILDALVLVVLSARDVRGATAPQSLGVSFIPDR